MSVASEIEQLIVEEISMGRDLGTLEHDEDLLASDIVDSLGIMEMVAFLERQYGIAVSDSELTPENFQTVDSIVAFIESKRVGPRC
jgi:acyl carrier protein